MTHAQDTLVVVTGKLLQERYNFEPLAFPITIIGRKALVLFFTSFPYDSSKVPRSQ